MREVSVCASVSVEVSVCASVSVEVNVCSTMTVEASVCATAGVEASMCASATVEVKFWRSPQTVRLLQQLPTHPASHVHTCLPHIGHSVVPRTVPQEQRSSGHMYHQSRDGVLQALP